MNIDALHAFRDVECETFYKIIRSLPIPNSSVLEIGGGTGYQAQKLYDRGLNVTSIDVDTSNYRDAQVYPVQNYDGRDLPFECNTFDAVFSSNVLEHILDIEHTLGEIRRVLKPDGIAIHILPTSAWRFWTTLAGHWLLTLDSLKHMRSSWKRPLDILRNLKSLAFNLVQGPPRHGERGNGWSELWLFSKRCWLSEFRKGGFHVYASFPMRLFYTGHQLKGKRLGMKFRRYLSYPLGSACRVYVMKRLPSPHQPVA